MMDKMGWQSFVVSIPEKFWIINKNKYIKENFFDSLSNCSIIKNTETESSKELKLVITNICDKFNVREYEIKKI